MCESRKRMCIVLSVKVDESASADIFFAARSVDCEPDVGRVGLKTGLCEYETRRQAGQKKGFCSITS